MAPWQRSMLLLLVGGLMLEAGMSAPRDFTSGLRLGVGGQQRGRRLAQEVVVRVGHAADAAALLPADSSASQASRRRGPSVGSAR